MAVVADVWSATKVRTAELRLLAPKTVSSIQTAPFRFCSRRWTWRNFLFPLFPSETRRDFFARHWSLLFLREGSSIATWPCGTSYSLPSSWLKYPTSALAAPSAPEVTTTRRRLAGGGPWNGERCNFRQMLL